MLKITRFERNLNVADTNSKVRDCDSCDEVNNNKRIKSVKIKN